MSFHYLMLLQRFATSFFSNCTAKEPPEEAKDDKVALRLWLTSEKWTRLAENLQKMKAEIVELEKQPKEPSLADSKVLETTAK